MELGNSTKLNASFKGFIPTLEQEHSDRTLIRNFSCFMVQFSEDGICLNLSRRILDFFIRVFNMVILRIVDNVHTIWKSAFTFLFLDTLQLFSVTFRPFLFLFWFGCILYAADFKVEIGLPNYLSILKQKFWHKWILFFCVCVCIKKKLG